MTSGDVFHKIRFLVIDKVENAAFGFSESCIHFYLLSYISPQPSAIFFIHPPCIRRSKKMMPRKVSSIAIAVQTPGNP